MSAAPPQGRKDSRLKLFLNEHGQAVDYFCAFLLIGLCLIVLLPKVHDSFLVTEGKEVEHQHEQVATSSVATTTTASTTTTQPNVTINNLETESQLDEVLISAVVPEDQQPIPPPDNHHGHHHHHHHHGSFPTGELLICIGFFVFYCVGFSMDGPHRQPQSSNLADESRPVMISTNKRRQSTCCTSSRNPTGVRKGSLDELTTRRTSTESGMLAQTHANHHQRADEDCVMLLNRHHQHHTHSKHFDTAIATTATTFTSNALNRYGSTTQRSSSMNFLNASDLAAAVEPFEQDSISTKKRRPNTTIVVDEIRIISEPVASEGSTSAEVHWPHSLKMLVFSGLLTAFLVFFDMRMLGMLSAIKVFRACSTGALLYVAFFIMLPTDRAGCNSCKEEEI